MEEKNRQNQIQSDALQAASVPQSDGQGKDAEPPALPARGQENALQAAPVPQSDGQGKDAEPSASPAGGQKNALQAAPVSQSDGKGKDAGLSASPSRGRENALQAAPVPQSDGQGKDAEPSASPVGGHENAMQAAPVPQSDGQGKDAGLSASPVASTKETGKRYYLMCERNWIYFTLMVVSGFFGAFTYILRGNVFCNAQTGNVVLMGIALGAGEWSQALYYLIPISAYLLGAFVSELLPNPVKHRLPIRWDTLFIAIEMAAVIALGFVPESAPVQISQVAINFIASMQYNTFRQAQGEPVATTFVTNHIRQIGVGVAKAVMHIRSKDKSYRTKLYKHLFMVIFFIVGAVAGTLLCNLFLGHAIWFTLLPLGVVFAALLYADLAPEKDMKDKKPGGH